MAPTVSNAQPAAGTYTACNQYGECWRVHRMYAYGADAPITYYNSDWYGTHQHDEHVHWLSDPSDDRGYYEQDGRWHEDAGARAVAGGAEGAGIGAWDLRATRVALASVLRRRPEPYHDAIRSPDPLEAAVAKPHELAGLLEYDDHERRSGLIRLRRSDSHSVGDFDRGPWTMELTTDHRLEVTRRWDGIAARKTIAVEGDRHDGTLAVSVEIDAEHEFEGSVELEWNVNVMGGGANPAAYYRSGSDEWRHDSRGHIPAGADLSFGNTYEGVDISLSADPPARAQWFAVETVSNSEAGFERVYQGSCVTVRWPLSLVAGQSATFATTLSFTQSRDRSAEEAAAS